MYIENVSSKWKNHTYSKKSWEKTPEVQIHTYTRPMLLNIEHGYSEQKDKRLFKNKYKRIYIN